LKPKVLKPLDLSCDWLTGKWSWRLRLEQLEEQSLVVSAYEGWSKVAG
jgi:hypothetical protein